MQNIAKKINYVHLHIIYKRIELLIASINVIILRSLLTN